MTPSQKKIVASFRKSARAHGSDLVDQLSDDQIVEAGLRMLAAINEFSNRIQRAGEVITKAMLDTVEASRQAKPAGRRAKRK